MTPPTALLLSAMISSTAGSCTTIADCNWAGDCVGGTCSCAVGFCGAACKKLAMASFRPGAGGLLVANGTTTWGGSVVAADDGTHHMYAAMMTNNATLQKWLTNSVVLHAVSTSGPAGPYEPADVALAPRPPPFFDSIMLHNPDAKRAPDGTYLIFYDGSSDGEDIHLNQRVGLATAPGPYGPWTRRDAPILSPASGTSAWDNLFVTNPGPYVYPNGSVLLVYKAKGSGSTGMVQGVAFAEHWTGPYRRLTPDAPIVLPGDCEDPGIYRDAVRGVFRMVLHCGCAYQLMRSMDGIRWAKHGVEESSGWCKGVEVN